MVNVEAPGLSEAVVRTVREPLLILDGDLRIRAANPAFYAIFGEDPEYTLGHTLFELGGGQWDVAALRELLEDVLPHDRVVEDFEVEHEFPRLGRRYMVLNARRLESAGAPLILLAIQDLTERIRAQKDLERSNQELERFAYVASHDLQEPLRMIASYTQLLARRYEGRLDDRADRYIAYAVEGAERMKTLIRDLLKYARIGTEGAQLVPVDPESVMAEVLRDLRLRIQETDTRITHDPLPGVQADRGQLRQVFQNLIENAIKFSGDRAPVIHVAGRRQGLWTTISVRDSGVGIAPEYRDKIFLIFHRLHGRDTVGTGIGLALCKRIVERHGGTLSVESEPGTGSTFSFTLPSSGGDT